ncbi:hypothetical protein [Deefgea rivuli]|uniref:hypothetical protein n=1 Tax=Deefgea rivuli TaxID=400948 RepID=UPI0004890D57|nr:hypothetical protein [Deefgea rivuli]
MRLMMVMILASPLAFSKNVSIRCNVVPECQTQWESPLERMPPQIKLACQGQAVQAKMSTIREAKWQKVSFDF